ncbi:MAG: hypothetical protein IMY72_07190 [Bacteroidetes bacterium]|nr:hypothetical protein [Bacteroidota bacterium]
MKKSIIILTFFFLKAFVYGQNDSVFFFNEFDEFNVSINKTNLEDNNTNDGFDFGIGAYHTFLSDKNVNILFGFEFNRTKQFKEYMYEGHFANSSDLTYFINSISIPVTARFNMGRHVKIFCETGAFLDIHPGARRKGIMHTYLPNDNNQVEYKEFEFDERANISSINYGISIGIGINVPVSKFNLIIKPEYKFGIKTLYDYKDQIFNRYFRIIIGLKI